MVCLRPTVRTVLQGGTAGQDMIVHKGITIQFEDGHFDTKTWRDYERPESPDNLNIVKCEDDLIKLVQANRYFGQFFKVYNPGETLAEKKARIKEELAKLEQEELVTNPDPNAPAVLGNTGDGDKTSTPPVVPETKVVTKNKKTAPQAKSKKKNSKVDL